MPVYLAMVKDDLYVTVSNRVEQWCLGAAHCRKVLDVGEAINGINTGMLAGIGCEKDGSLLVTDPEIESYAPGMVSAVS